MSFVFTFLMFAALPTVILLFLAFRRPPAPNFPRGLSWQWLAPLAFLLGAGAASTMPFFTDPSDHGPGNIIWGACVAAVGVALLFFVREPWRGAAAVVVGYVHGVATWLYFSAAQSDVTGLSGMAYAIVVWLGLIGGGVVAALITRDRLRRH